MKIIKELSNLISDINKSHYDIIFITVTFMLCVLYFHDPLRNIDLESWDGLIGPAVIDGISISKRINNFYLLFWVIIPITFICCFVCFKKLFSVRENYKQTFLNLSALIFIAILSSYISEYRSSSLIKTFTLIYAHFIALAVIDKHQKLKFEEHVIILLRTLVVGLSLTIIFHLNFKLSYGLAILATLIFDYLRLKYYSNIASISLKKFNFFQALDNLLNISVFLPFIFRIVLEISYIIISRNVFIPHLFGIVLASSLLIFTLSYVILQYKSIRLTSNAIYLGVLLSIGTITLVSCSYYLSWSYGSAANLYEIGNRSVVIDSLNSFKLPIIDYFSAHALADVLPSIIYSLFYDDKFSFLVTPYWGVVALFSFLILFKLVNVITKSKEFAILFVLFVPVLYWPIKIVSLCFIVVLAFCRILKDESLKSFILFSFAILFSSFYLYDEGICLSFGCVVSIILAYLINKRYSPLLKLILSFLVSFLFLSFFLFVYAKVNEINLLSRLLEWKSVSVDSSKIWATPAFGKPSTIGFVITYYISPLCAVVMLGYSILTIKKLGNKTNISIYLILVFSVAQIVYIPRTIVYHNLFVCQAKSPVTLNFVVWSVSLFFSYIIKDKTSKHTGISVIDESKFSKYSSFVYSRAFVFTFPSLILLIGALISNNYPKENTYLISKIGDSQYIKVNDVQPINISTKTTSRVIFDDKSRILVNKFKSIFDTLLSEEQTYIDFANLTSLYALTDRKRPSYVGQTPSLLTDIYSQEEYLKQVESFDCPIALLGNSKSNYLSQMIGIPHNIRYYLVAEYIYKNYQPLVAFDEYAIWCKKELKEHYIKILEQLVT